MRLRWFVALLILLPCPQYLGGQDLTVADPFWSLIHDDAVLADLKVTTEQRKKIRAVLDPLDVQSFPLRNKSADEAAQGFAAATAEARQEIGKILKAQQAQRLAQIMVRYQGPLALLRNDLAQKLALTDEQRTTIRDALKTAQRARTNLQKDLRAAKTDTKAAETEWTTINEREREAVNAVLTTDQKQKLAGLIARDFDVAKLGRTAFKTPELAGDSAAWLNSSPLTTEQLRGKVLVVHFFAFGCINCIHNYPTYREWQSDFASRDVNFIGIHTPETKAEHNVETLKEKLKAEELHFPVLVDNDLANWNAFGNSMWPSVYVIDKQGYMRAFWAGELRWQGASGDQQMKQTIEKLIAER